MLILTRILLALSLLTAGTAYADQSSIAVPESSAEFKARHGSNDPSNFDNVAKYFLNPALRALAGNFNGTACSSIQSPLPYQWCVSTGGTPTANMYDGSNWVPVFSISGGTTAFLGSGILRSANNLLDIASPSAARTNLGLGSLATLNALPAPTSSVLGGVKSSTAGTNQFQTGIDTSGGPIFAQPAFSNLSGTAGITQGGTGTASLPAGLLKGAGTSALTAAIAGTDYLAPAGSGAGLSGVLKPSNNLSDLASPSTSRTNLGLPSDATVAKSCRRIEEFGGAGDNSTVNDAAFAAWAATLSGLTSNACLEFGRGNYIFNTKQTVTVPSGLVVTVKGAGASATLIYFASSTTAGFTFQENSQGSSVSFKGATLYTNLANAGDAIKVSNGQCLGYYPNNVFDDLYISYVSSGYWSTGLNFNNVSTVQIDKVVFSGDAGNHTNGIAITGSSTGGAPSGPCYAVDYSIRDVHAFNVNAGLNIGSYVQGVVADWLDVTSGYYGIYVAAPSTSGGMLVVSNSQFNTSLDQVSINGLYQNILIQKSLFLIPNGYSGVNIQGAGNQYSIIANQFDAAILVGGGNGIVNYSGTQASYEDNQFINLGLGIALGSGSDILVNGNHYYGTTTPVINVGATNVALNDWSPAPAISSCGTTPSVDATSDSYSGRFTTGTGAPTSCTLTWASGFTYGTSNKCTVTPANAAAAATPVYVSSNVLTGLTATFVSGVTSGIYNYTCKGK